MPAAQNPAPTPRYLLVVAEPTVPSNDVMQLFLRNGVAVLLLHDLEGDTRQLIKQATLAQPGQPLVLWLDVYAADMAKRKPHDLAAAAMAELKPTVVRLTRADRAEQAVRHWRALNPQTPYDYADIKPTYIHFRDLQAALAKHLTRGHMEIQAADLSRAWSGHVTNLGHSLGLRFKAGKAPATENSDPDLDSAVNQFREDLGRQGKPKQQPSVQTQVSFQRASRTPEETKREVQVNQTALVHRTVHKAASKLPAGKQPKNLGTGPSRTEPMVMSGDRAKSVGGMPMSSDKPRGQAGTPANTRVSGPKRPGERGVTSSVPELKVRPFPGTPATKQAPVNPLLPRKKEAPVVSSPKVRGANYVEALPEPAGNKLVSKGYWEDRKHFRYYREVVTLGKRLCPAPQSVLDVGGRDCKYALEFGAPQVTQVDPDRWMNDGNTTWFQEDFMSWVPDKHYDLVLCLQVLEHVEDPAAFLRKLLTCGQVVIVSLPYNWPHSHEHKHNQIKPEQVRAWAGVSEREFKLVEEPGKNPANARRMVFVYVQPTKTVSAPATPVSAPAAKGPVLVVPNTDGQAEAEGEEVTTAVAAEPKAPRKLKKH